MEHPTIVTASPDQEMEHPTIGLLQLWSWYFSNRTKLDETVEKVKKVTLNLKQSINMIFD